VQKHGNNKTRVIRRLRLGTYNIWIKRGDDVRVDGKKLVKAVILGAAKLKDFELYETPVDDGGIQLSILKKPAKRAPEADGHFLVVFTKSDCRLKDGKRHAAIDVLPNRFYRIWVSDRTIDTDNLYLSFKNISKGQITVIPRFRPETNSFYLSVRPKDSK
jgi:hypothetical protein